VVRELSQSLGDLAHQARNGKETIPAAAGSRDQRTGSGPGQVLDIKVVCAVEAADDVAALFVDYGFTQGVIIEAASGDDLDVARFNGASGPFVTVRSALSAGDVSEEDLEDTRQLLWVVRQTLWVMGRSRPVGDLEIVESPEAESANAWKANYSVHRIGTRVFVKAAWHEYEPQPGEIVIALDPGSAFGTGWHGSTQLTMQALEEELKAGDRVLDVGVGSGVLATAAALLGAGAVDGVDIDPEAIRAARENVERNGVGQIVNVALGSIGPDGPFPGPFDLVVANIIARVLIVLAPDLARVVKPGGTLILGGILDEKEASVQDAFAPLDLALVRRITRDDWVALVFRKPD